MTLNFIRTFASFAFAVVIAMTVSTTSHATIVGAQAFGDALAGATIKVTYGGGGSHTEAISAGAPGQGVASAPGFFDFSVSGDTFLSDWSLTNLNDDFILLVEFDLTGSDSLFDDGSLPSTLNGYAGRFGAVQTNAGAPTINNSFEQNPWTDAMNLGDEFVAETIEYLSQDFRRGLTSTWRDDTDIIGVDTGPELPEPTTAALLVLAGLGLSVVSNRRR